MLSSTILLGLAGLFVAFVNGALVSVANFGSNPTGLEMNIYVPSTLATNPAVILAVNIPLLDNKNLANDFV